MKSISNNLPESNLNTTLARREYLVLIVLFAVALAGFSLKWPFALGGPTNAAAQRILAGEIPYRDFWTLYAPGSFYLHALALKIFGYHVLVEAIASSVISSTAVCMFYRVVVRLLDRPVSGLICAALAFAVIFSTGYHMSLGPYPMTLLLILTTLYYMVLFFREGRYQLLFAAGLATGLAIVFKHDVGVYTGIAVTVGLVASNYTGGTLPATNLRLLLRGLILYLVGAAIIAIPVAVYFAIMAGNDLWQDLIVFPATAFRYARPESYPSLLPTGLYHPWLLEMAFRILNYLNYLLLFIIAVTASVGVAKAIMARRHGCTAMVLICVVAFWFHYSSAQVQINTNIISMTVYAALLGAILHNMAESRITPARHRLFGMIVLLVAAGWFIALIANPVYRLAESYHLKTAEVSLPRASGIMVSPRYLRELMYVSDYVQVHVPRDRKIFLALHRHDIAVIGYSVLYFVLERLNATRHDQLHPGIVDTAIIQRQIIEDLKSADVQVILINHMFEDDTLDRVRDKQKVHLPKTGATELDQYIRQYYYHVSGHDRFEIWQRKPDRADTMD